MNIEKKKREALIHLNQNNIAMALDNLQKIYEIKPKDIDVLKYLAMINLQISNTREGIVYLQKLINIKFDLSYAKNLLIAYETLRDWDAIISLYQSWIVKHKLNLEIIALVAKAYRENSEFEKSKELLDLGFREIISSRGPANIVAIEWAEKVKNILPPDALWIKFSYLGKNKRRIEI